MRRVDRDLLRGRGPEPPRELSDSSHELWGAIVGAKLARSPERLEALHEALRLRDRLAEIRAALVGAPLTVTSERSGLTRANPLLRLESETARDFARRWRELGLNEREGIDSRDDRRDRGWNERQ